MNNKDFINALSARSGLSPKETQRIANLFISEMIEKIDEETTVSIQGFGAFDIKKKLERIIVNPLTKKRILIPPKLVLMFKPSSVIRERMR